MPIRVSQKCDHQYHIIYLGLLCLFLHACLSPITSDQDNVDSSVEAGSNLAGANNSEESGTEAGEESGTEAGEDSGTEAGEDSGTEAGEESGTEAGEDSGTEAGEESGTEAGEDSGTEAGEDSGTEAGEDSGTEAGEDSGTEAGEDSGTEAGEDSGTEAGEMNPLCMDPLTFIHDRLAVNPLSIKRLEIIGGSGEFKFTLIESPSGGIINEDIGTYLAGDMSGVTDVVEVLDQECDERIEISVDIVETTKVLPSQPHINLGQSIQFEILGGSGEYEFSWILNTSGGELSEEGYYQAGDTLGEDRIQIHDVRTREEIRVIINVVNQITIDIEPNLSWIPTGSTQTFQVQGGSGVYDYEWVTDYPEDQVPTVNIDADQVTFEAHGHHAGRLVIHDRFLDAQTSAHVQQLRSLTYSGIRSTKDHRESNMLSWPDQDGDGINELIFATGEPDLDGVAETGAVYIYKSTTRELVQRLTAPERASRFGRQIVVGDWNGDGISDLIVSAQFADRENIVDVGAVYIYQGVPDGTVDPEPRLKLLGPRSSGRMGTGLALCDFNGDGWRDLAIGAWLSEVPGQGTNDQGMIYIHLGSESGFFEEPDQLIEGKALRTENGSNTPTWLATANHRIGYELAAGDLDGDGLCDLVASSYSTRGTLNVANTGEVHVYRGVETLDDPLPHALAGGVSPLPVVAMTAHSNDGAEARLGRRLLVADRDGDGRSELLVSQTRCDVGFNNSGAVYLYTWDTLPNEAASSYITTAEAQEVFRGTSGSEYFGYSLAVGDFDGDQDLDLAIGGYAGEISGGPSNAGKLNLFLYDQETARYETSPSYVMSGENANDNVGESVAILGVGHVASFAYGVDTLGPNVGMPFWGTLVDVPDMEGVQTIELSALTYEADVGNGQFGISFDLFDQGEDGIIDVIAGASYTAIEAVSVVRSGASFIYQIPEASHDADDVNEYNPWSPTQSLTNFRGHSGYDHFGTDAQFIGDFDGDGQGDVAVVARFEDLPNNFNQDTVDRQGCPASARNNTGAVYIFRGLVEGGFASEPSFIIYGKVANENLNKVNGELDMNDDQRADLLVGSRFLDVGGIGNDAGRAAVFLGRPAPIDGTRLVICEADFELIGERAGSRMGWAVEVLGDLNQDGCDEAIFGQPDMRVDGRNRQGTAHIIYGWGGATCFDEPHILSLTANDNEGRFGSSLAGADLDFDGRPELIVGAYNGRNDGMRPGVVRIIRSAALQNLAPIPIDQDKVYHDVSLWEDSQVWQFNGDSHVQQYGRSIAAMTGYLLIGIPRQGDDLGIYYGGAHLYRFNTDGSYRRVGVVTGETSIHYSELGRVVDLHSTGEQAWIGIGSLWGIGTHAQGGSVYVGTFTP